jgi:HK97 family phage portal protein
MLDNFLRLLGVAPPEQKLGRGRALVAMHGVGRPVWTARDPALRIRAGFERNPVVHRAVRMLAEQAAAVPLLLFEGEREIAEHPLLALLNRPNGQQGGGAFLEALILHLLLAGNAYAEVALLDGEPRELHVLRPDRMRLIPGRDGWAEAYDYQVGSETVRFRQEADPIPPILHVVLPHPMDDHYGLAPLEAAGMAVDLHNAASAWNKALLDNAARPSGALVYAGPEGSNLSTDQYERLKAELDTEMAGPANAGRPLLLDGGLDWKPMALSPSDMDFLQAKHGAAREIALSFGVPPMLLGIPGDNTYSNYQEANRALFRQTVLPLLGRFTTALANWLGPAFGEAALRLEPDLDRIEALGPDREALWRRVSAADFLSADEKRAAVGYGVLG